MSEQTEQARVVRVLRWEEPPPAYAGRVRTRYDLADLRWDLVARPGVWGVVNVGSAREASAVALVIRGRLRTHRGEVETTTRRVGDEYLTYARWVPEVAS